ncbi:MAG TPA: hypothetical protein VIM53_00695 [Candidatus Saccharimonadales bacterium]
MKRGRSSKSHRNALALFGVLVLFVTIALTPFGGKAYGDQLQNRQLEISSSVGGTHDVVYNFSFGFLQSETLGSIEFQFCSNDPLIGDPCTAPYGFDALNVQLASQSGEGGFFVSGSSTVNDILLTRPASSATPGNANYVFTQIINPTDAGSYYVRLLAYPTTDGTGAPNDTGGIAFALNSQISLSAQVPPYLLFCAGTNIVGFDCTTATNEYIDFGDLSSSTPSAADTQLVIATNGQGGYGIWVTGTTLTSGNNVIPALAADTASQTGTNQFGLNLADNTSPQVGASVQGPGTATVEPNYAAANRFRFVSGEELASVPHADDYRKYTVSYVVNVAKSQPPGVYVSTLTYVATANF